MTNTPSRRNRIVTRLLAILFLLMVVALLLQRCAKEDPPSDATPTGTASTPGDDRPQVNTPSGAAVLDERLTPATISAPPQVPAGSTFTAEWTGPDNSGDCVAIAREDAPSEGFLTYAETSQGRALLLTAPIDAGAYELRYVSARSRTVLGRASVEVTAVAATLDGPSEVVLGGVFSVSWTGPNNPGDYVTIVASDAPDAQYGDYAETSRGSQLELTAPTGTGAAEIRYVTGQGHRVLARRPIRVLDAAVALSAADAAIAGSTIEVTWTGPNNAGDYITIIEPGAADEKYGNYTNTSDGSPLKLLMPVQTGEAELRYVVAQGRKVLARRTIEILAAQIALSAPESCKAAAELTIQFTGPSHSGDYITIVAATQPDGRYGAYKDAASGSPLTIKAPDDAGECEIRYVSGQGNQVLARRPIRVEP